MKRDLWPLMALASTEDGILSPVQMQKALFLLGDRIPQATSTGFYHFESYHYGPFDRTVYLDTERLIDAGLVKKSLGGKGRDFVLTDTGKRLADEIASSAGAPSPGSLQYLKTVATWAKSLSFEDLIKSIYKAYPQFRKNSIFRESP